MREPPAGLQEDDVLPVIRDQWIPSVDQVDYLPLGFGAHHWAAFDHGVPRLFVTLDHLGDRHDTASLEAAYAAAAELARTGLEFVVPCLPTASGRCTVPFVDGALSATEWVEGQRPNDAADVVHLVRRLHASTPPAGTPRWRPLVPATFSPELEERLAGRWSAGPHAAAAQRALRRRVDQIRVWTDAYHRLGRAALERTWVPTHGEPHRMNLLATRTGLKLIDWESLKLAPAERDLRDLPAADADRGMVELFDLEWRLDEISQYATWFERPHGDTEDDRTALEGLVQELNRS